MPELRSEPSKGCVVHCRSHHHLVEEVWPPEEDGLDTVVRLACLDDDANGQITEVFWVREVDARLLGQSTWETIGASMTPGCFPATCIPCSGRLIAELLNE